MYKILEKEFNNKNEIVDYCRDIIERNIEKEVKDEDFNFIVEIFGNNPSWVEKSKNMVSIFVSKDRYNKNYCFYVKNKNGTCDDVSYHKSIKYIDVYCDKKIELILPFGKYKGLSIYEIDDVGYFEWIIKKDISRDLKVKIGQFLRYGYIPLNKVSYFKSKAIQKSKYLF